MDIDNCIPWDAIRLKRATRKAACDIRYVQIELHNYH
jgi:hypothetical protein